MFPSSAWSLRTEKIFNDKWNATFDPMRHNERFSTGGRLASIASVPPPKQKTFKSAQMIPESVSFNALTYQANKPQRVHEFENPIQILYCSTFKIPFSAEVVELIKMNLK